MTRAQIVADEAAHAETLGAAYARKTKAPLNANVFAVPVKPGLQLVHEPNCFTTARNDAVYDRQFYDERRVRATQRFGSACVGRVEREKREQAKSTSCPRVINYDPRITRSRRNIPKWLAVGKRLYVGAMV